MGLFKKDNSNLITYYRDEDNLHPRLREAFAWYDEKVARYINGERPILAGGALRSFFTDTPVNDFDLYRNDSASISLKSPTGVVTIQWKNTLETDRSWVYKSACLDEQNDLSLTTFNVIKKKWRTPQEVIDSFDFTVCMCGMTNEVITYHPDYFTDLATRTLRIHNQEDPFSTYWRLQKYIKLGFSISREESWKLIEYMHDENLPTVVTKKEEKKETGGVTLAELFSTS